MSLQLLVFGGLRKQSVWQAHDTKLGRLLCTLLITLIEPIASATTDDYFLIDADDVRLAMNRPFFA